MGKVIATMKPTLNRLEVRELQQKNVTASGLSITPNPVKYGLVLAVGPCAYNHQGGSVPLPFKVGDVVVYRSWVTEIRANDNMLNLIMTEDQVLGILDPKSI